MCDHGRAERLFASDQCERSRKVLHHQVRGCSHLLLISFHSKVLHGELPRGNSCNGHRPLDDGGNDLAHGPVDCDVDKSLENVVAVEERDLAVEDNLVGQRL